MSLSFQYCPVCGTAYQKQSKQILVHICPNSNCRFELYENQNTTASGIIIHNDQLLLVKRAKNPRQGYWDFPGGFVEPTESPQQAAQREIKEELGVDCEIVTIFNAYGPTEYIYQNKKTFNCDLYFFVKPLSLKFIPANDVADYAWFDFDKLPSNDLIAFPTQVQLINDLKTDYA